MEFSAEQTLVQQAQRGDRDAFAKIVREHQGAVYGYLRARLMQVDDAEDLMQEVFLRCYLAQARFDSTSQLRPWLLGIARNTLREHIRKLKRRKEVAWTELCLELEERAPAHDERYVEFVGQLPQCRGGGGPGARQALDMHYAARLRLTQISEQLKRSEGAVKLLLYRARQALKRCLDGGEDRLSEEQPT
jgi:RNA polymerase sigma-70 factor (ECF subfamily)